MMLRKKHLLVAFALVQCQLVRTETPPKNLPIAPKHSPAEIATQLIVTLKKQIAQQEVDQAIQTFDQLLQSCQNCSLNNELAFIRIAKQLAAFLWDQTEQQAAIDCLHKFGKQRKAPWIVLEILVYEAKLINSLDPPKAFRKLMSLQSKMPLEEWSEEAKMTYLEIELETERFFLDKIQKAESAYEQGNHASAAQLFHSLYEAKKNPQTLPKRLHKNNSFSTNILMQKTCENLILQEKAPKAVLLLRKHLNNLSKQKKEQEEDSEIFLLRRLMALALRETGHFDEAHEELAVLMEDDKSMQDEYFIDKAILCTSQGKNEEAEDTLHKVIGMGNLVHPHTKNRALFTLARLLAKTNPEEAKTFLVTASPQTTLEKKEKAYLEGLLAKETNCLHAAKHFFLEAIDMQQHTLWKEDAVFHLATLVEKELSEMNHEAKNTIWKQISKTFNEQTKLKAKTVLILSRIEADIHAHAPNLHLYDQLKRTWTQAPNQGEALYFLIHQSVRANALDETAQFLGLLLDERFASTPWPTLSWLFLTAQALEKEESIFYKKILEQAIQALEKTLQKKNMSPFT